MMEFKIEKGIPIPSRGKWLQLAEKMEDGDSVLLSLQDSINLKRAFRNIYAREGKFSCVARQESPHSFRVWKRKVNKSKKKVS